MFYKIHIVDNTVRVAPLAQLVECGTLDCKVTGSNLTMGAMLYP